MVQGSHSKDSVEVICMAQDSVYFSVNKAVGLHDTKTLKRALDALPGVTSVSINKLQSNIAVDYDDTGVSRAQIRQKIELLGYPIEATQQNQAF